MLKINEILLRKPLTLLLLPTLVACSSGGGDSSRPPMADAPPFDFDSATALRSGMHSLAFELQQLDIALGTTAEAGSGMQPQVVRSLSNIERIGSSLERDTFGPQHSFLQRDMRNFRSWVGMARRGAENNPPNYYMAGRVSGGCVNCHEVNR